MCPVRPYSRGGQCQSSRATSRLGFKDIPASAQVAQSMIEPPVLEQEYPETLTCWCPLSTADVHPCLTG
ncbi:hypothetical protein FKM82_004163 [Ascaphus truei]